MYRNEWESFHGKYPVESCSIVKGYQHCGECLNIPCNLLLEYLCDKEHGDKPEGIRIRIYKEWMNLYKK